MKKYIEATIAVIFLLLLTTGFFMALSARCSGAMNPVRQQIKMESLIQ